MVPVVAQGPWVDVAARGFMVAVHDLQAVPAVNGVIDGTDLVYRDYYDISIAVATPKGLVVPVLRNVEDLDFAGVERVRTTLMCKYAALLNCGALCFRLSSAAAMCWQSWKR